MKRIDDNQTEIVKKLRKIGCSVAITSMMGNGFPDFVVGFRGANYLIELKDGNKAPSKRVLTEHEEKFHLAWRGQVCVYKDFDEVYKIVMSKAAGR